MNPKTYLPTFLIFAVIFLSTFSVNAQNSSDTIQMRNTGLGGKAYYKDNVKLNFSEVMQLTRSNPEAYKFMDKASTMRIGSYIFGIPGGFVFGFALGHGLGRTMLGNPINKTLFYSMLGAGAALIGVGIGFEIGAKSNVKKGVAVFNNVIRQKNSANLDLGFSSNGIFLKFNF
jgi:phosphoribosylformylglycinamidine (FGAM) synthase-like amidotransferase family enzyme